MVADRTLEFGVLVKHSSSTHFTLDNTKMLISYRGDVGNPNEYTKITRFDSVSDTSAWTLSFAWLPLDPTPYNIITEKASTMYLVCVYTKVFALDKATGAA